MAVVSKPSYQLSPLMARFGRLVSSLTPGDARDSPSDLSIGNAEKTRPNITGAVGNVDISPVRVIGTLGSFRVPCRVRIVVSDDVLKYATGPLAYVLCVQFGRAVAWSAAPDSAFNPESMIAVLSG